MNPEHENRASASLIEFLRDKFPNAVEWANFVLIFWVLIQTLIGFGGYLAYGLPMLGISKSLIALGLVHLIFTLVRNNPPQFHWILLAPLPLLACSGLHYWLISPYRSFSGSLFSVYLQCYALFIIVYSSVNGVRSAKWMLLLLQAPVLIAVVTAFLSFYLFPVWIQDANRVPDPGYLQGAGGFLQDPMNLGGLIILVLPVIIMGIYKYRFNGPAMSYYSLAAGLLAIGIVMSSRITGIAVALCIVAIIPFLASGRWRNRVKIYKWIALVVPGALLLLWFGTDRAHERMRYILEGESDPVASVSRHVGVSAFLDHPVAGVGLGGYSEVYDQYDSQPGGSSSFHAAGSYHEMLAETGFTGTMLFFCTVLVIGSWSILKWRKILFIRLNEEVARRLKTFTKHHPIHRKLRREKGRMPFRKAAAGGLMAGIMGLLMYATFDFSLKLPIVLFYLSCMAGLLVALCRGYATRGSRFGSITLSLFAFCATIVAGIIGVPSHYSNYLVFTAEEDLSRLLAEPHLVFRSQMDLRYVESRLEMAIDLVPGNASAWKALATAEMLYLAAELESPQQVARDALPAIDKALELNAKSWESHFNAAVANILVGNSPGRAVEHLRQAVAYAPARPEPRALLGAILLAQGNSVQEGRALLLEAIQLQPDYTLAANLLRRNQTASGSLDESNRNLPLFASQFRILPQPDNRVNGAGLPRWQ